MPDIATLISQMRAQGQFNGAINNQFAQFGTASRAYLGARFLPERTVTTNSYQESAIKLRSLVAPAGARYGPAQKRGNKLFGTFNVALGNSNIAYEFTSEDYEALSNLLNGGNTDDMAGMARVLDIFNSQVVDPLAQHNEVNRWQAIIQGQVTLIGDNGFNEVIPYPNPTGHRFNATGQWSSNSFDPFVDIQAAVDLLASKGYSAYAGVTSRPVASIMGNNVNVKTRTGYAQFTPSGQLVGLGGRASLNSINSRLNQDDLPELVTYDLLYSTDSSTGYFFDRAAMVIFGQTDQNTTVDRGDGVTLDLGNLIGYTAIGKAVAQSTPGRYTNVQEYTNLPPRIEMEGAQTSLPIINEPEAFVVIGGIN